jgi:hypothetical protein
MEKAPDLDVNKAVRNFLTGFESLARLPFISDAEMEQVFGEEVNAGLAKLDALNRQKDFCRECSDRCCRLVDCELYSDFLICCPVYSYRPALCRMHFCHKFALEYPLLVKKLGDVFLDSCLAAQLVDQRKAILLDSPPLNKYAPELIAEISAQLDSVKENKLDEGSALDIIESIIQNAGEC